MTSQSVRPREGIAFMAPACLREAPAAYRLLRKAATTASSSGDGTGKREPVESVRRAATEVRGLHLRELVRYEVLQMHAHE